MPKYKVTRTRHEVYLADVANAEQAIEVAFHEDNDEFWVAVEDLDVDVIEIGPGEHDAESETENLEALAAALADDPDLADVQITAEEAIASHLFEYYREGIWESEAAEAGRALLSMVVRDLSVADFAALKGLLS